MNISEFASALGEKFTSPVRPSPQSAEKDEAVAIARRILSSGGSVGATESQILARQLLRALALPA